MPEFDIAQLNVARALGPMDGEVMAGFMQRLDEINALAEQSPGFVWRLKGENNNNTALKVTADPLFIVNFSVWRSIDDLWAFTYASTHKELFKQRFDWFERSQTPSLVMWWVPRGTIPDIHEALGRLRRLSDDGPTPEAFTFKQRFPPPGA
jgi:hypothetical protein